MPITYSIDAGVGVIFEVWTGQITADYLRSYWQAYLADPEVIELRRTLVDMREARIQFTGQELLSLVTSVVTPALQGLDWKTAIVIAHPVQFGVSKQYQVFAEHYSRDAIFENYDEALRWLTQPG